jgi:diacylglycerol kinase
MTPSPSRLASRASRTTFWQSLKIALAGAAYVLRTERNIRIEAGVGLLVIVAGLIFRVSWAEWAILWGLIFLVLALETLNTAIESVVDLVTQEYHPLAKLAKDSAAGAVLLMVIGSIGVGIAIFGPRLWALLPL